MVLSTSGIWSLLVTWAIKTDDHWILQECEQNSDSKSKGLNTINRLHNIRMVFPVPIGRWVQLLFVIRILLTLKKTSADNVGRKNRWPPNFSILNKWMIIIDRLHNIRMVFQVPIRRWIQLRLRSEFCSNS